MDVVKKNNKLYISCDPYDGLFIKDNIDNITRVNYNEKIWFSYKDERCDTLNGTEEDYYKIVKALME